MDEAGIALEVDSSGFAARLRAEVEQALNEATRGAGNTVNINVTGDDFDDTRIRTKIRTLETYVNTVRNRQREQDRRYFLLLNQRINQTFNRLKLRITQLKAQLASLKNVKIEVDLDLNEDRIRERLAELSRNRGLTLNVDVDLAKARAEIDAFRKEQEANPINIDVRVDEQALARLTRGLGTATQGTTGLTRSTEGLNRALGDEEAVAARVAALEEKLGDARAKSEAATSKRAAAEEALSRAEAQHERTGAALEQAEQRLADLRSRTAVSTKELEQAEADAAKARDAHSVSTERYFTAESKATTAKNAAERASRDITKAERDHQTALDGVADAHERAGSAGQRHVGILSRIRQEFLTVNNRTSVLSRTLRAVSESFEGGGRAASVFGKAAGAAADGAQVLASNLSSLASGATNIVGTLASLGSKVALFGAVAGAATFAVGGLTAAVAAAPAAITGLAAAVGVAALAFDGFGDAIKDANTPEELKKQQEALAKLHPEARKVAEVFNRDLKPAFDGFKKAIQGEFFKGLDQPFKQLVQTINGALKPGLLAVTGSVNAFVKQLLGIVTGEQGVRRVNNALAAAKSFLDQLLPAVGNLVRSFLDLAGVEPIARAIGGAFSDILNEVSRFFDELARSPEAVAAVEALRGVVKNLTGEFLDVARSAMNFFTQSAPGFNNLVDAAGGLARTLIDDLGGAFNTVLQAGADFINSIPPATIDEIKNAVKSLADRFLEFANGDAPRRIAEGLRDLIKVAELVIDTIEILIDTWGFLTDASDATADSIDRLLGVTRDADGTINGMGKTSEEVDASLRRFRGSSDDAAGSATKLGDAAKEGADKIGAAAPAAAAGAERIVNGIKIPFDKLPGITQERIDKLDPILKDGLARAIQSGTTEVSKLPPDLQKALKPAPDAAGEALAPTPDKVKAALDPVASVADAAGKSIVDAIKQSLTGAGPAATEALAGFPQAVKAALDGAASQATASCVRVVQAVRTELTKVPQVARDALGTGVKDAVTKATADGERAMTDGVARIVTAANFAGIATSAETELAKIPVSVQTHLTTAVTTATTLGQQLQQFWAALMQSMVQLTEQGWQQMLQTEQQGAQQSIQIVQALAQQIQQIFAQLAEVLYVAGYNMMLRLAQGIQQGGQQAIQAAQQVAQAIQGLFPMSPPKWGPLSGEGDPLKSGGRIMSRVAEGIEANSAQVTAALAPALNAIAGSLDNATPGQRAAAVAGSTPAAATRVANARTLPAADTGASSSGPSAADIEAATYAGTARALGEAKVQMAGGFIEYVTAGQRRDDRRAGRRGTR